MLRMARGQVPEGDASLAAAIDEAAVELRHAIGELRELARGIHPAVLTEAGLSSALVSLAERSTSARRGRRGSGGRYPPGVEEAVYFVVSESLANAAKHAGDARARHDHRGRGTPRRKADDDRRDRRRRQRRRRRVARLRSAHGLADRVEALDGTLTVHSPAGHGTRVLAELPCAS
ncbi:sensor histidine kinase [Yinghuangia aomiensis]